MLDPDSVSGELGPSRWVRICDPPRDEMLQSCFIEKSWSFFDHINQRCIAIFKAGSLKMIQTSWHQSIEIISIFSNLEMMMFHTNLYNQKNIFIIIPYKNNKMIFIPALNNGATFWRRSARTGTSVSAMGRRSAFGSQCGNCFFFELQDHKKQNPFYEFFFDGFLWIWDQMFP